MKQFHNPVILQSVQFSCSVVSDSLWPHRLQHARPPCPSPTPGVYSNSCPLSQWCHPTISSSVVPFSSHLQSFSASGCFLMSQLFASGRQSIGVSASTSVLPMNIQDWFPSQRTGWISLQSKSPCTLKSLHQHLSSSVLKDSNKPQLGHTSSSMNVIRAGDVMLWFCLLTLTVVTCLPLKSVSHAMTVPEELVSWREIRTFVFQEGPFG